MSTHLSGKGYDPDPTEYDVSGFVRKFVGEIIDNVETLQQAGYFTNEQRNFLERFLWKFPSALQVTENRTWAQGAENGQEPLPADKFQRLTSKLPCFSCLQKQSPDSAIVSSNETLTENSFAGNKSQDNNNDNNDVDETQKSMFLEGEPDLDIRASELTKHQTHDESQQKNTLKGSSVVQSRSKLPVGKSRPPYVIPPWPKHIMPAPEGVSTHLQAISNFQQVSQVSLQHTPEPVSKLVASDPTGGRTLAFGEGKSMTSTKPEILLRHAGSPEDKPTRNTTTVLNIKSHVLSGPIQDKSEVAKHKVSEQSSDNKGEERGGNSKKSSTYLTPISFVRSSTHRRLPSIEEVLPELGLGSKTAQTSQTPGETSKATLPTLSKTSPQAAAEAIDGWKTYAAIQGNQQTGTTSRGRAMLRKMGWKEGTGLGLNGTGILEPLTHVPRNNNAGVGAESIPGTETPPLRVPEASSDKSAVKTPEFATKLHPHEWDAAQFHEWYSRDIPSPVDMRW